MYFIFDAETNGMGQNNHCISIGYIMVGEDMKLIEKGYKLFCRPDLKKSQWNYHAEKVHGISWEKSNEEGLDPSFEWPKIIDKINACEYIVAHNINFDWQVIKSDTKRLNISSPKEIKKICTLKIAREIWPKRSNKLPEVFNRLYLGKDFNKIFKHHDAMADARACANIFQKLYTNGFIKIKDYGREEILF